MERLGDNMSFAIKLIFYIILFLYLGLTDTDFKSRFANHKQSFRNEAHSNQTELTKHVWQLKKAKVDYTIRWKILDRAQSNATKR